MPVENEKKYVMHVSDAEAFKNTLRALPGAQIVSLRQGYLNENTRIREVKNFNTVFIFTFKQRINGETIEIEKEISKEDFEKLWTKVNKVIVKDRVIVPDGYLNWEVDFFKAMDDGRTFLVMAEIEMPEGMIAPGSVPSYIKDNLVYEVAADDKRFINAKLSSPKVIEKLVKEFKNGKL